MKRLITIAILLCALFSINVNAQWLLRLSESSRFIRAEPTPLPVRQVIDGLAGSFWGGQISELYNQPLCVQELLQQSTETQPPSVSTIIERGYKSLGDLPSVSNTYRFLNPRLEEKLFQVFLQEMKTSGKDFSERDFVDFIKKNHPQTLILPQKKEDIDYIPLTKEYEIFCQEKSIESKSLQSYPIEFTAKQNGTNNIALSISAPINKLDLLKQFYENEVKKMPKLNRFGSEELKVNQTFIFYITIQDEYALAA